MDLMECLRRDRLSILSLITTSVEFSKSYLSAYPSFTFKTNVSSTHNGFSSHDEWGKRLAQELNRESISAEVHLDYLGRGFTASHPTLPYLYQLSLHLNSWKGKVFKKLWDRFENDIKLFVYLEPTMNIPNSAGPLVSSGRMTINSKNYTCTSEVPFHAFLPDYIGMKREWKLTIIAISKLRTSKMLDLELYTDVTILAGNGAKIKAHKAYLSAGSPVLEATFKNKMRESVTGILDMKDLTEKGVRAFLRYLYLKDLTAPKKDIEVAYDLLYAAHKYHIPKLEQSMTVYLRVADEADFGVELAYRIYTFARLWDPTSALKMKAVRILRSKWEEFVVTQEYQEIFNDGPNSAGAKEFLEDIVKPQFDFDYYPQKISSRKHEPLRKVAGEKKRDNMTKLIREAEALAALLTAINGPIPVDTFPLSAQGLGYVI